MTIRKDIAEKVKEYPEFLLFNYKTKKLKRKIILTPESQKEYEERKGYNVKRVYVPTKRDYYAKKELSFIKENQIYFFEDNDGNMRLCYSGIEGEEKNDKINIHEILIKKNVEAIIEVQEYPPFVSGAYKKDYRGIPVYKSEKQKS